VGILPARKYIETGKMPVPQLDARPTITMTLARCQFYSLMPVLQPIAYC